MDTELRQLADEARERSMTYSFLARALADEEIPLSFLDSLSSMELETGTELDAFACGLAEMDADGREQQRKELAADHASSLRGMSVDPVSPYEAVHTGEKRLMMQEARDKVVAAYRQQGFGASQDLRVPEDHISLELSFMAALCERFAATVEAHANTDDQVQGDVEGQGAVEGTSLSAEAQELMQAQAAFVSDHLVPWVPGFCDELEDHATTPFYRGVAQMLRLFVEDEAASLSPQEG